MLGKQKQQVALRKFILYMRKIRLRMFKKLSQGHVGSGLSRLQTNSFGIRHVGYVVLVKLFNFL